MQGETPTLRLGYRPEVLVFLAEGRAPYSLLAGSARAERAPAVLPALVDALRQQRGQDWQPFAVQDGNLITGQNPQSSELVARHVLTSLRRAA